MIRIHRNHESRSRHLPSELLHAPDDLVDVEDVGLLYLLGDVLGRLVCGDERNHRDGSLDPHSHGSGDGSLIQKEDQSPLIHVQP